MAKTLSNMKDSSFVSLDAGCANIGGFCMNKLTVTVIYGSKVNAYISS